MITVSQTAFNQLTSESSDMALLILLEIHHPNQPDIQRFVQNGENVIHQGNEYQHYPFEITFPQSTNDDQKITSKITIGNIDQDILAMLRRMTEAPDITIKLVYFDGNQSPPESDTVEYGPIKLKYKRHDVTPETITGTLSYKEDFLNQAFLSRTMNPKTAAGIFS